MSAALMEKLADSGLLVEMGDGDYARTGFHHVHVAHAGRISEVSVLLRDEGYFLEMVTCLDLRETEGKMRIVYTFNRFDVANRHRVQIDLDPGSTVASITRVFPAANWMEREVYDMYGVVFAEHPAMKRILLPEDADFFPLLKDFGRIDEPADEAIVDGEVEE